MCRLHFRLLFLLRRSLAFSRLLLSFLAFFGLQSDLVLDLRLEELEVGPEAGVQLQQRTGSRLSVRLELVTHGEKEDGLKEKLQKRILEEIKEKN